MIEEGLGRRWRGGERRKRLLLLYFFSPCSCQTKTGSIYGILVTALQGSRLNLEKKNPSLPPPMQKILHNLVALLPLTSWVIKIAGKAKTGRQGSSIIRFSFQCQKRKKRKKLKREWHGDRASMHMHTERNTHRDIWLCCLTVDAAGLLKFLSVSYSIYTCCNFNQGCVGFPRVMIHSWRRPCAMHNAQQLRWHLMPLNCPNPKMDRCKWKQAT